MSVFRHHEMVKEFDVVFHGGFLVREIGDDEQDYLKKRFRSVHGGGGPSVGFNLDGW